jgi:hypothetical protein
MTMNRKQARQALNELMKKDSQNVVALICDRIQLAAKKGQIESVADLRMIYNDVIGEVEDNLIEQDLMKDEAK